jgi:ABC-2 type transport system permease protein
VIADVVTVADKELKELLQASGGLRGGRAGLAIMLVVFGVVLPAQNGVEWLQSPAPMVVWSWVPLFLVAGVVSDSFAGERERHTLETLLASRLSDRAILAGKVSASVVYGWGFTLAAVVLGAASVNALDWQGHIVLFPPLVLGGVVGFSLLTAVAAAAAGVLVSLRAPTVRQAAQTLSIGVMLLLFVPVFGIRALPEATRASLAAWAGGVGLTALAMGLAAVLLTLDAALLAAGLARFRRARLIID